MLKIYFGLLLIIALTRTHGVKRIVRGKGDRLRRERDGCQHAVDVAGTLGTVAAGENSINDGGIIGSDLA